MSAQEVCDRTRHVGDMEEHFGVRLFQRTTRRLSLTEDGQDPLQYALRMTELEQEPEGALGRQRDRPAAWPASGPTAGVTLMTPRLRGLMDAYPAPSIEFVVMDQFGDMIEERLDIALHVGQPPDSSLLVAPDRRLWRRVAAAPAIWSSAARPARPADLADHDKSVRIPGMDA